MRTLPLAPASIALICAATWMLSHSYLGLFHDAGLYTLQALWHSDPAAFADDVFLKFGSQDRYTIFSVVYARAGEWLGIEPAAAALTLLSQAALLTAAFTLVRSVAGNDMALCGIAVVLAVPGDYGADRIFNCIEPFLTPRMAAEALTVGSLAAALAHRRTLAGLCLLVAVLLHPVMAAAGVATLLCLYVAIPRPRLALTAAAAGLAAVAIALAAMPAQWGRFDATWLHLIQLRSPYLFISHWTVDDWSGAAVCLATLGIGSRVLHDSRARALSIAVLLTVSSGFALTWIACDHLHVVLLTQAQPWRWHWLGTLLAALLLPQILTALWGTEARGPTRTTAVLLVAAWVFGATIYALASILCALASMIGLRRLKPDEARWVWFGAWGLLIIAAAWRFASNLEFTAAHYIDADIPLWIRRSMSFVHDGMAPLALAAAIVLLGRSRRARPALLLTASSLGILCCALAPTTWASWTRREFPPRQMVQFEALRAKIAPGADVFWPESPVAVWLLLGHPSYLSVTQTSGMVFSRASALELDRRALALSAAVAPEVFMNWSSAGSAVSLAPAQLSEACRSGAFAFMVTAADLGIEPLAFVPSATGPKSKKIRLYRCPV